ncbi:MAG: hypothetical protein ACT4N8_01235 [Sphingosinicella sp.]|uniref:hypothetical protein n=1 Tax=Sphingosinicella sp. TaxID=1917971 RepID=UPI004037F9E1
MASGRWPSRRFTSINGRELERRGVSGSDVAVRLEGATLAIEGEQGGHVAIPAERVDLIRQFRMGPVHSLHLKTPPIYETKIWWDGGSRPVLLMPVENQPAYQALIAEFAAHVAEAHGLERLRIGPGPTTAIVNLLIVGIPCLFLFAFVFWVALVDGGWWWLGAMATFMLFFWLAGRNLVSRWPRRVRSIDQFLAELR